MAAAPGRWHTLAVLPCRQAELQAHFSRSLDLGFSCAPLSSPRRVTIDRGFKLSVLASSPKKIRATPPPAASLDGAQPCPPRAGAAPAAGPSILGPVRRTSQAPFCWARLLRSFAFYHDSVGPRCLLSHLMSEETEHGRSVLWPRGDGNSPAAILRPSPSALPSVLQWACHGLWSLQKVPYRSSVLGWDRFTVNS